MRYRRIALAVFALVVGTGPLSRCHRNLDGSGVATWPPIVDASALRREATDLCRLEGGWRELPPTWYPPAMTALHPASISVSRERVYVAFVPVPGGHRYHGYYIWPDGRIEREESDERNIGS